MILYLYTHTRIKHVYRAVIKPRGVFLSDVATADFCCYNIMLYVCNAAMDYTHINAKIFRVLLLLIIMCVCIRRIRYALTSMLNKN